MQATAPGGGAAFAAVSGDSLTVRDSRAPVYLVAAWADFQVDGFIRFTSPLMHDAVVGMQLAIEAGNNPPLYRSPFQQLFPQDSIVAFGAGSAVAGDIETASMLWLYHDLPGVDGYFIEPLELLKRGEEIYSFTNTIATGIAGGYSGSELINAEQDQLKANTDYAIIGANVAGAAACTIRWLGVDWGNLGVGMPGVTGSGQFMSRWFWQLSQILGMPAIPVFNSSNKSNTFISAVQDENGGDPIVTTLCVRLAPRGRGSRQ
ncbi:MAG: hypothetical protein L0177_09510 [Chloroflexi bacterium]|nr:hypothetical protein [Chloroflexota bacterium]